jgi:hypothetical protein
MLRLFPSLQENQVFQARKTSALFTSSLSRLFSFVHFLYAGCMYIIFVRVALYRFATVKYDHTGKNLWNPCMHLCNYSINKYHSGTGHPRGYSRYRNFMTKFIEPSCNTRCRRRHFLSSINQNYVRQHQLIIV